MKKLIPFRDIFQISTPEELVQLYDLAKENVTYDHNGNEITYGGRTYGIKPVFKEPGFYEIDYQINENHHFYIEIEKKDSATVLSTLEAELAILNLDLEAIHNKIEELTSAIKDFLCIMSES